MSWAANLFQLIIRFGGWLVRGVVAVAPYWVAKITAGLGLALVTNQFVVDPLLNLVKSQMMGFSGVADDVIHATGFDVAVSMVFAAYSIRQAARIAIARQSSP